MCDRLDKNLGVRGATEIGAGRLTFTAQLGGVIDFAVVAQHIATVRGDHRLASGDREIDDGKAAMADRDTGLSVGPASAVVRPPAE